VLAAAVVVVVVVAVRCTQYSTQVCPLSCSFLFLSMQEGSRRSRSRSHISVNRSIRSIRSSQPEIPRKVALYRCPVSLSVDTGGELLSLPVAQWASRSPAGILSPSALGSAGPSRFGASASISGASDSISGASASISRASGPTSGASASISGPEYLNTGGEGGGGRGGDTAGGGGWGDTTGGGGPGFGVHPLGVTIPLGGARAEAIPEGEAAPLSGRIPLGGARMVWRCEAPCKVSALSALAVDGGSAYVSITLCIRYSIRTSNILLRTGL